MENKYEFKGCAAPWSIKWDFDHYKINSEDWMSFVKVWINDDKKLEQTAEANAHLIAAAPDLLEACKEALKELELTNAYNPLRIKLKSAIHKALNITL